MRESFDCESFVGGAAVLIAAPIVAGILCCRYAGEHRDLARSVARWNEANARAERLLDDLEADADLELSLATAGKLP